MQLKAEDLILALEEGIPLSSLLTNLADDVTTHVQELRRKAEEYGPRSAHRRGLLATAADNAGYVRGLREAINVLNVAEGWAIRHGTGWPVQEGRHNAHNR